MLLDRKTDIETVGALGVSAHDNVFRANFHMGLPQDCMEVLKQMGLVLELGGGDSLKADFADRSLGAFFPDEPQDSVATVFDCTADGILLRPGRKWGDSSRT